MEANNDSTGNEDPLPPEELTETALMLVQQLHQDGAINDDERDSLKDMIFDEDAKLFGLLQRYSDESEADELRNQMIAYVKAQKDFDMNNELQEYEQAHPEQLQNGVFEMGSPGDFAIEMKKRKKLARLNKHKDQ